MNVPETINAYIERDEGLGFLTRDRASFHARDGSVVFSTPFSKAEIDLRKKYKLTTEVVQGKCHRALFYDFQRNVITNPMDASSIRVMDIGSACEDCEREYYKKVGLYHSSHIRMFNKEFQISGEIDCFIFEYEDVVDTLGKPTGIIKIIEPRRLIGVEVKSFYGYYAEKEILIAGIPKWNHVLQALVYLDHYKPNIPYWLLIYISRGGAIDTPLGRTNSRQFKLQLSKLTGEIFIDGLIVKEFNIKDVQARFKKAQFLIDNGQLPERDYVYNYPKELVDLRVSNGEISKKEHSDWKNGYKYISDWQCLYCPYLYDCWKDVHGDKVRGAGENKKNNAELKEEESKDGKISNEGTK